MNQKGEKMDYMRNKGRLLTVLLLIMLLIGMFMVSDAFGAQKIHTYYTGLDVVGTGLSQREERYRVYSYMLSKSIKYSKKREIGEIRNNTSRTATKSLSISKTTSRTFSLSVSSVIPKKVMQNDVSATIGGSLSFNYTISLSASASVPPKKSKSVFLQYKTTTCRYKYVIQRQERKLYGKWKNKGKTTTKSNTVITKVPVLVV